MRQRTLLALIVLGLLLIPAASAASYSAESMGTLLITNINPVVDNFWIELRPGTPDKSVVLLGAATGAANVVQVPNVKDEDIGVGEGFTQLKTTVQGSASLPATSSSKAEAFIGPQIILVNRSNQAVTVGFSSSYSITAASSNGPSGGSASSFSTATAYAGLTDIYNVETFTDGNVSGLKTFDSTISAPEPDDVEVEIVGLYLYSSGHAEVPEPASFTLVGFGCLALPFAARRRNRAV